MPVRAGSVWRQISERSERRPFGLPSVKGELAKSAVIAGCSASPTRIFATMSASSAEIEIGLNGRGAKHHVESARSDPGHVALHDAVAALRHDRRLGKRPLRAHAERQKADAQRARRPRGNARDGVELLGRVVRGVERRAGQFELSAGLQRNRGAAGRVEEPDQMAAVLDPLPAEPRVHALEQRADPPFALIGHGRQVGAIEGIFSCSVPTRNGPAGLHPASNQAASASRDSTISPSATSRAIKASTPAAGDPADAAR